jgi:hypothetical protein
VQKRENDRLIGMWVHPVGGWEICYYKDGKKHSEYRKDKKEAELRAEFWKASLTPPSETPADEDYVHPVIYWERKLRDVVEMMLSQPGDRELAATCRAIAAAATAAMRSAKYLRAPDQETNPDSAPIQGDITKLTTQELADLVAKKA